MTQPLNKPKKDNFSSKSNVELLTLSEAVELLEKKYQRSYTVVGLRKACDEGRLEAELHGQGNRATWYTTEASMVKFIETNRGPGRPPAATTGANGENSNTHRQASSRNKGEGEAKMPLVTSPARNSGPVSYKDSYQALTLSLNNQKGGVGKTTSVTSLACIFASYGLKVLIVDNDPQANAGLQFGIGLDNNRPAHSMYEVYLGQLPIREVIVETGVEGVHLAPASIELSEVEQRLTSMNGADRRLDKALATIKTDYDLIIVDSPPNLGKLVVNSLVACDWFLIPIEGSDALRAIKSILNLVAENAAYNDKTAELAGIFLTMMYKSNVMVSLREAAQSLYPGYCLNSEVRRSNIVKEATATTTPLPVYAPQSEIVEDYRHLAVEIAERIGLALPVANKPAAASNSRRR